MEALRWFSERGRKEKIYRTDSPTANTESGLSSGRDPPSRPRLDHDVFRSNRPKNMNVLDSRKLRRRMRAENRTHFPHPALRSVEIRDTRGGLFDETTLSAPQTRRCWISVTSTEMRRGEIAVLRYVVSWGMQSAILSAPPERRQTHESLSTGLSRNAGSRICASSDRSGNGLCGKDRCRGRARC